MNKGQPKMTINLETALKDHQSCTALRQPRDRPSIMQIKVELKFKILKYIAEFRSTAIYLNLVFRNYL